MTLRPGINIEKFARELFIQYGFRFYSDSGSALNRSAATELWDTGKYRIEDYGGDDFDFTCNEKEKDQWRAKAREFLKKVMIL